MANLNPYRLLWLPLICLVLGNTQCTDSSGKHSGKQTVRVDSQQKISEKSGGFNGNLDAGDQFGSAVVSIGDLEGDGVTDLAVGVPYNDSGGKDRGAVWILFMDSNGRVDTQQKIADGAGNFDGNLDNDDRFGSAVASEDDLNVDGVTDLAVGAPGDDAGGTDKGALWILFLNADGSVRLYQKISDTAGGFGGNLKDGDEFGSAVASIGDLDGDGVTDLAVGAPYTDAGGTDRGAIWILFLDRDGKVRAQQKIADGAGGFKGDLKDGDRFGSAVAGLGDLDGDGINDLAVGADQSDIGGTDRGAVWILFMDSDGRVRSEQKIADGAGGFKGNLKDGDRFGSAVAGIGNLDNQNLSDMAVGAPLDDDGGTDKGALWILFLKQAN